MKSNGTTAKGRVRAVLRAVADIVSNPVYANYTHSGPSSLPTGQAGAAGRMAGPYIGQDSRTIGERPNPALANGIENAMPYIGQRHWQQAPVTECQS